MERNAVPATEVPPRMFLELIDNTGNLGLSASVARGQSDHTRAHAPEGGGRRE